MGRVSKVNSGSQLIKGLIGKGRNKLADDELGNAPLRLDEDAVRLLEAMHRGCFVSLDDDDGLRWHVEPRTVVPMRLYDEDEITLVDVDSDEMLSGTTAGPRQHLPDWPEDEPFIRLGAGILLIRTGLAVRKGTSLFLTPRGRVLAASRIGQGVDIAGQAVDSEPGIAAIAYEVSEGQIEHSPFRLIEGDQRITVLPSPDGDGAVLRLSAGTRRMDAALAKTDVKRTFATLRQAIDRRGRCLEPLSETTRLLKGGRSEKIEIEGLQDFERAIVALRPPHIDAFMEAVEGR